MTEAALRLGPAPLQYQMTGQSLFRTCFLLPSCTVAKPIGLWRISYRQLDDPESLVDAGNDFKPPS